MLSIGARPSVGISQRRSTLGKENSGSPTQRQARAETYGLLLRTALALSKAEIHPQLRRALRAVEQGAAETNPHFVILLNRAGLSRADFLAHLPTGAGISLLSLATEISPENLARDLLHFVLQQESTPEFEGHVPHLLKDLRTFITRFGDAESTEDTLASIHQQISLYAGTASFGAQLGFSLKQVARQFPNPAMVGGLALSMPLHALTRYALVSRGVGLWRANLAAFAVDGAAFSTGESLAHGVQGVQDARSLGARLFESYRMLGVMRFTGGAVGTLARTPFLKYAMTRSPMLRVSIQGALPHVSAFGGLSLSEMAFHGQSFGGSLLPSAMGVLHFAGAKSVLHVAAPRLASYSQSLERATQQAAYDGMIQMPNHVRAQLHSWMGSASSHFAASFQHALASGPASPGTTTSVGSKIRAKDLVMQMADEGSGRASSSTSWPGWPSGRSRQFIVSMDPSRVSRIANQLPDAFHSKAKAVATYLPRLQTRLFGLGDSRLMGPQAAQTLFIWLANNASQGGAKPSPKLYEGFMNAWERLDTSVSRWAPQRGEGNPRVEVLDTLLKLSQNFGRDYTAFGVGVPKVLSAWEKTYQLSPATSTGWPVIRDSLTTWSKPSRAYFGRFAQDIPALLVVAKRHQASPQQAISWVQAAYVPWRRVAKAGDLHPVTPARVKIEELARKAQTSYPKRTFSETPRGFKPIGSGQEKPFVAPSPIRRDTRGHEAKHSVRINAPTWLERARGDRTVGGHGLSDVAILSGLQGLGAQEIAGLMGITPQRVQGLAEASKISVASLDPAQRTQLNAILRAENKGTRHPLTAALKNAQDQGIAAGPLTIAYLQAQARGTRPIDVKTATAAQLQRLLSPLAGLTHQEMADYLGVSKNVFEYYRDNASNGEINFNQLPASIPKPLKNRGFSDAGRLTTRELYYRMMHILANSKRPRVQALADQVTLHGIAYLRERALAPDAPSSVTPPLTVDLLVRDLIEATSS